ncbi:general substrate transporter [Lipomyces orientalis]|uniref:General substrate transporter n=1 Tax=Lipomyces orientalis TaxID=1233043 RepID=A0ACC3TQS6_9ASCO
MSITTKTRMLDFYRRRATGAFRGTKLLLLTTLLSSLGFSLIGYDNGLMGGFIDGIQFGRVFNHPRADIKSTIVAIYEVGGFIGAIFISFAGETFGRRQSIALGAIIMMIGAVIQASAYELAQMFVGRIVSGIGIGVINSTVPILQAEVSPKATRGLFVGMYCTTLNFGIVTAYWLDYGLSFYDSEFAWRFPTAFQLVFLLIILILTSIVPESPRWLAAHDMEDDARRVIGNLTDKDDTDPSVTDQFNDIKETIIMEKGEESGSWKDFYRKDGLQSRRRLWTACGIQMFQQLGGINALIYYAKTLFEQSIGFDSKKAGMMSGLLQTWLFVASFIPWYLIDRIGRKPLILGGIMVQCAVMIVQTALIYQVENKTSIQHTAAIGAAAMLFIFEGAFTIGMQSTVWVYPTEVLPLGLRSKGSAISTAANWICNFLIVEITPPAIQNIGWRTYIIFAIFNASFVPIVFFYFKETRGLSLEEVDLLFASEEALQRHDMAVQQVTAEKTTEHFLELKLPETTV